MRGSDGYTLLELLVVIAIMGLIAALAVPSASRAIASATLNADARRAAGDLWHLQQLAKQRQETITVAAENGGARVSPNEAAPDFTSLPVSFPAGAISYFADGTTSGGTLRIREGTHALDIDVAWFTGAISMRPADDAE